MFNVNLIGTETPERGLGLVLGERGVVVDSRAIGRQKEQERSFSNALITDTSLRGTKQSLRKQSGLAYPTFVCRDRFVPRNDVVL